MKLPEIAVRRPTTVVMFFLGILLIGAVAMFRLSIDLFPEIEPPAISVLTLYRGANASDVEADVTKYIEDSMSVVNNLEDIISLQKTFYTIGKPPIYSYQFQLLYSTSYIIAHNVFNVMLPERHLSKINSTACETLSNVGKYLL